MGSKRHQRINIIVAVFENLEILDPGSRGSARGHTFSSGSQGRPHIQRLLSYQVQITKGCKKDLTRPEPLALRIIPFTQLVPMGHPFRTKDEWLFECGASLLTLCPGSGVGGYRPQTKKQPQILFAKESNTNRTNLDFPFFRPVGPLRPLGVGF